MTDLPTQLTIPRDRAAVPASITSRLPSAALIGLFVAFVVWLAIVLLAEPFGRPWGTGMEAISYWANHLDAPYANSDWTKPGAYVYSPAFLQLVAPIAALPWVVFIAVWTAIMLVAVRYLTGPRLFALGALLAVVELSGGNISLLLAVAMVVGFRWPATWAFVILTKVTPGIGLLWFVVRREWGQLGIALGATAAVVAVSFAIMPGAWLEWVQVLVRIAGRDGTWAAVPIPFIARLPFAIAVVVWGARTNRRWTVPVAGMLALPALWYGGLSMLLAVIVLREQEARLDPVAVSAAERITRTSR
jgi:Glycosyltransferase family 87